MPPLQCTIQSAALSMVLGIYNACHDTEPVPFGVVHISPPLQCMSMVQQCITPA